jgi:hypothetical protein
VGAPISLKILIFILLKIYKKYSIFHNSHHPRSKHETTSIHALLIKSFETIPNAWQVARDLNLRNKIPSQLRDG